MSEPRLGDLVRVTFEGRYVRHDPAGAHVVEHDATWNYTSSNSRVEVIELAAHASRDEVGSIRSGLCGTLPLIKVGPDQWVQLTKGEGGIEVVSDDDMAPGFSERELLGVVPGSPAAEAELVVEGRFFESGNGRLYRVSGARVEFRLNSGEWWKSGDYLTVDSFKDAVRKGDLVEVDEP